jgi:hypothetical protein
LTIKSIHLLLKKLKIANCCGALKSGICSIKSGICCTKERENAGICRNCTLPVFTRKYPAFRLNFSVNLLLFCAVNALPCWDWLWLFFVSSKQCFCPYKTLLLILNKNNAPHECGNPKCKVIALGWLSDERFPRDHRHQSAASLANRIAGARKLLASAADAELHQLECVVPGDALSIQGFPVHQLARSWLQY